LIENKTTDKNILIKFILNFLKILNSWMKLYRAPPSNSAVMKEAMKLAKNKGKLITFSNLSN
jgi:hypothetical protein